MQLTDRVYMVGSGASGFSLSHYSDCHIYLIDGGGELALIDAGTGPGHADIARIIQAHGFDLQQIRYLFLTHLHGDHAGGAAGWRRAIPGLQVLTADTVADWLRTGDEKAISLDKGKQGGYYEESYRFEPCPVAVELCEGRQIRVGAVTINTLDTPGHCQGHLCFVMKETVADRQRTYLFSGDNLFFGGRILLQSIWDCDLQAQLRSIEKLAGLGVDVFLPGHGSISMQDGQRHVTAAMGWIERCLVPPSFL